MCVEYLQKYRNTEMNAYIYMRDGPIMCIDGNTIIIGPYSTMNELLQELNIGLNAVAQHVYGYTIFNSKYHYTTCVERHKSIRKLIEVDSHDKIR